MKHSAVAGLYAITPEMPDDDALFAAVAAALRGGVTTVQYRQKSATNGVFVRRARRLRALCKRHGAAFVINDDPAAAKQLGADGVHLGAEDAPVATARRMLGGAAIVGATCGNDLTAAQAAAKNGASYVAFGAVFPSETKPAARRCSLSLLAEAKKHLALPLVAVGGISPANIAAVAAVADAAAVCAGLFSAADIAAAAAKMCAAFSPPGKRQNAA